MIIKSSQLAQLSEKKIEEFVRKTARFLHDNYTTWAEGKSFDEITGFVASICDFARKYKIHEETNIEKLCQYFIIYGLQNPVHRKLEIILNDYKFDENLRIESLYLSLESGRYQLLEITLGSDLENIG